MHGDTLFISLTCDLRQFLFRPVRNALMSIGIDRVYKSGTALHRAVHKHLEPIGLDVRSLVFLRGSSLFQGLIHIHPAVQFPCGTQHKVHVASLVHLLGSLVEVIIEEIGGVAVLIHRIALREQLLLDASHVCLGDIDGEKILIVQERTHVGASLFLHVASRYAVSIQHNFTAAHFRLAGRTVLFDETCLLQQDGVGKTLVSFLVSEIDGDVTADLIQ